MGVWTGITADDGHQLTAYRACAGDVVAPGIVLLQEIFGVTPEMQALADKFQEFGYCVVVPALYDRIYEDCVIEYRDPTLARATKDKLHYEETEYDIKAAIKVADNGHGVALIGYCWGGGLAYRVAQKTNVQAVISYYGTNLVQYCTSPPPTAPCQFHFGIDDPMIDSRARQLIRRSCRSIDQYFEYEGAGHAFVNVARPNYRQVQADLAEERCMAFLDAMFHQSASARY